MQTSLNRGSLVKSGAKGHHSALVRNSEANGMLHAFNHGKSHLYRRYLGHREHGEKRVCEEDEITALIMGPLDYLPAPAVGLFWQGLLRREGRVVQPAFPDAPVSHARMRFWPRRGVEPDLVVELGWSSGERRILLVEFKWNAPLSGEDQLHRQWHEFLTDTERKDAYHLFIAPEISSGLNAISRADIWHGQLILHSWISVLNVVRELRVSEFTGLEKWKEQMTCFFARLGVLRFQGFLSLSTPSTVSRTPVFWRPVCGFSELVAPAVSSFDQPTAFFESTAP